MSDHAMNEQRDHDTRLRAWRTGIDTYQEPIVYMRSDCVVCRSEGFTTQTRVLLTAGTRSAVATLNVVEGNWLALGVAGLSEAAWHALDPAADAWIDVSYAPTLDSLSHVRAKVYGHRLDAGAFNAVIGDVAAGRYSDLYLAAFVTACAGDRLDLSETVALTRAMVAVGHRLDWGRETVVDKHCVGGLPGNRTTLLVVPIVDHAQDILARDHVAGRHRRHDGGAGASGPGHRRDAAHR